jgi:isocitrate/isopropylmalate dehydrogenase
VGGQFDVAFTFTEALVGGAAIDAVGTPLPDETLAVCKSADAVLLAAIGGCVPRPARHAHPRRRHYPGHMPRRAVAARRVTRLPARAPHDSQSCLKTIA